MKREITTHQVPGDVPQNQLQIAVVDEPGSGGAPHHYLIFGGNPNGTIEDGPAVQLDILFQKGPIKETGLLGVTNESLLAVVADRLQCFQAGPYACADNAEALEHTLRAMSCLQRRTIERINRGVEGTMQK
jgi:hypothetical protein